MIGISHDFENPLKPATLALVELPTVRAISVLLLCSFAASAVNTLYNIETLAGTIFTGDGKAATAAVLVQPTGIAVDPAGNVYFADAGDHRVRRVGPDGIVQTVAGTGVAGMRGDGGPARQAQLNAPYGITLDAAGSLYIADLGNACIRKLGPEGTLTTIAGGGVDRPAPGTILKATQALLFQPRDVAVDRAGNLFIADFGAHMIYQVTRDGMLFVLAGTGAPGPAPQAVPVSVAGFSHPAAVAVDASGVLYIADSGNRRVRRLMLGFVFTVCDKDGKDVELMTPTGLAIDSLGRLYIADGASRTTVVTPAAELLSIGIGGLSVAVGPGLEVLMASERQILRLTGAVPVTLAGNRSGPGAGDGFNSNEWRFTSPSSVTRDDYGYLYVADTGNGRVRRLTPAGELTTVTTKLNAPVSVAFDSRGRLHVGDRTSGGVYTVDIAGQVRVLALADGRPMDPAALAFDSSDNLLIADTASQVIRKVTPAGAMSVIAGGGNETNDGPALLARLASPAGVAVDAQGDIWFTEAGTARLRRLSGGSITTLTGPQLKEPRGLRVAPDGTLLVADRGLHRVMRVSRSGEWAPVAGSGDQGWSGDGGAALAAVLNGPMDVVPMADGKLVIADSGNHRLRRLTPAATEIEPPVTQPPEPLAAPVEVLHAATLRAGPVAAGQLIILQKAAFPDAPQVFFGELPALVLNQAAGRLTVQVPPGLKEGASELSVMAGSAAAAKALLTVAPEAPGILTDAEGTGQALATNETGETNGAAAPAARGSVITLYLTGEGARPDTITARIGGYPAEVIWSGPAPGWPGLFQLNVRTPGGFSPSGIVQVVVTVNGASTQPGVTVVSR
jgi:uncharacterized protein (TIGR03437 family)